MDEKMQTRSFIYTEQLIRLELMINLNHRNFDGKFEQILLNINYQGYALQH